jgi:hypothetical protein
MKAFVFYGEHMYESVSAVVVAHDEAEARRLLAEKDPQGMGWFFANPSRSSVERVIDLSNPVVLDVNV